MLKRSGGRFPRGRKGATLVMVALLMFTLIGLTGIAIDFARMYLFKTELKKSADAAALAGAVQLKYKNPNNATAEAQTYGGFNLVENNAPTIATTDVQPGKWTSAAGFVQLAYNWTDPEVNAVRVVAHYPASYTLARVFGQQTQALQDTSVAALGFVGGSSCLKPWAVSYQTMLDNLFGPGVKNAATYNLTANDIQLLINNRTPIPLLLDNSTMVSGGNIQQVQVGSPWSGNNDYKAAIVGNCAIANMYIGPGTWLDALPGAGSGQTTNSVQTLCGATGNPQNFTCNVDVKLAVWDICRLNGGGACVNGANLQFRVKFVGVFHLTGYNKGNGPNPVAQVTGYFTAMADDGGFTSTPSPLYGSIALVQ